MKKFRVYSPELIDSSEPSIHVEHIEYGGHPDDPFIKYLEINAEDIGDQYHTIHELYKHRMALNIALFRAWNFISQDFPEYQIMRSKLHNDGTMFEGYFIVMALTPKGQISYHYKLKHWDDFDFLSEVDKTPKWDGHGSIEVIKRLMKM